MVTESDNPYAVPCSNDEMIVLRQALRGQRLLAFGLVIAIACRGIWKIAHETVGVVFVGHGQTIGSIPADDLRIMTLRAFTVLGSLVCLCAVINYMQIAFRCRAYVSAVVSTIAAAIVTAIDGWHLFSMPSPFLLLSATTGEICFVASSFTLLRRIDCLLTAAIFRPSARQLLIAGSVLLIIGVAAESNVDVIRYLRSGLPYVATASLVVYSICISSRINSRLISSREQ